jgi:hypothetical protein
MTENLLLPSQEWRLWPQFALRGPGFPATGVLRLAPDGLAAAADEFGVREQLSGPRWDEFATQFDAAAVKTALIMQEIAAAPAFRAAVAWQNPALLREGIAPFLAWTPSSATRKSKPRQREELVAHYWQRFCVKNDTIGFFGPVGWGRWDLDQKGIEIQPGEGLIANSEVFFSGWCVDTLARAIGADPQMREWIAPRRVPFVRVNADSVAVPGRPAEEIPAATRDLLVLCDGTRAVASLADELSRPTEDVVAELENLVAKRWIVWRLEAPAGPGAERYLRSTLERIGDVAVRERALASLDRLERARDQVRAAGMDADALAEAMAALETDFAELTSSAVQREKGKRTAPGRALVYADCRRATTATIGSAIFDELLPLDFCLLASRWMTGQFANAIAGHIRQSYERLRERNGTVDLGALWLECLPAPHRAAATEMERIRTELRAKWARIINAPTGASRIQLSSVDIADQVRAEFGEEGGRWHMSRYVSPDLLVIAEDADAVERGEFELVLGESHAAMNTVGAALFVCQHPDRDQLLAETTVDFPEPRLVPMLPKEQPPRLSSRGQPWLVRSEDYLVALADYTADPHRPRAIMSADVVVSERGDRLVAELPDGAEFDLLDAFSSALTNKAIDRFTVSPDDDHTPRVTIDRVTVARETWRFTASDLTFAEDVKSEARRFVRARHWREAAGLPRFVFVVSPTEPRPFYVDFDSPVYVNIFAKAVRRLAREVPGGRLTLSEMLPTPEQTWLTDDAGNQYTAELRLIAVDQGGGS